MKSLKKVIFLTIVICMLLFLGFYRDFVFKSINALLQAWDHNMDYYLPPSLKFLENYSYDTLVNIKWLLTLIFSILYLGISIIVIKFIFQNKKYIYITIGSYIGLITISALFIIIGILFSGISEKMYEFARYLMGIAQSPIILMILIPTFKIYEKETPLHLRK